MMLTREEKMNMLGLAGEKIIVNMLSSMGLTITHSVDPYDSKQDMLVDGYTVEVKTQVPFMMKDSFTIRPNQLNKCRGVDVLYFVSVPKGTVGECGTGYVYRVEPKNFRTTQYVTSDGRRMVLIPRDQPAVIQVYKIPDADIQILQKYTVSGS